MHPLGKIIILGIILTSIILLSSTILKNELQQGILYRMLIFLAEHILLFGFLIYYYLNPFEFLDSLDRVYWIIGVMLVNFVIFASGEVYLQTSQQMSFNITSDRLSHQGLIPVLVYLHLFYHFNILTGIFSLVVGIVCFFFQLQMESDAKRRQELLEALEEKSHEADGSQQPCSICLTVFNEKQSCYKLECTHIFHKQCLFNWVKYKATCPLCRHSIFDADNSSQE